jgi:hypothetical protein
VRCCGNARQWRQSRPQRHGASIEHERCAGLVVAALGRQTLG